MNKKKYYKNLLNYTISNVRDSKYDFSYLHYDEKFIDNFPKSLFKYCSFKKYTWNSIEKSTLYMAPASKMDDQFDCSINFSKEYIKSLNEEEIKKISLLKYKSYFVKSFGSFVNKKGKRYLDEILDLYSVDERKRVIAKRMLSNRIKISEAEIDNTIKGIDNFLEGLFKQKKFTKGLEKLFNIFRKQKRNTGIYSLTETNKSQIMWQMYANKYKGMCIEYDFSTWINDRSNDLFNVLPVIYEQKKEFDPIDIVIKGVLDRFLLGKSEAEVIYEYYYCYYLILITKHKEWSLQKEWRFIGKPKSFVDAPPIKAIYLGKKAKKENIEKIIEMSKDKFDVYILKENFNDLEIEYEKIN